MLIPDGRGGFVFPSYIAHLIANAGRVSHPMIAPFACATIVNSGTVSQTVNLTLRFGSYLMMDATTSVSVGAGRTMSSCLPVAFSFEALHRVTVATPGVITASATDGVGTNLGSANQSVAVLPIDSILVGGGTTATRNSLNDLIAVTVEPPQVRSILPSVSAASIFPGGFGDSGYRRGQLSRPAVAVRASSSFYDVFWLDAGESVDFSLSVAGGAVNAYVFTQSEYGSWFIGTPMAPASAVWSGLTSSTTRTFTAARAGIYYYVIHNIATDGTPRGVAWNRTNTRHDVASDALRAIYTTLQGRRFTYSNIPSDYFGAVGQHVRLPAESLSGAAGANCIDGSILFASVLELAGMEPVLFVVQGHAFVGVKARPANYNAIDSTMFSAPATVWAIETTMLGTDTYESAADTGVSERLMYMNAFSAGTSGAYYYEVDVAAQRRRGITPIP